MTKDSDLLELAHDHEVDPSYTDISGSHQAATHEGLRAVLGALGVNVDDPQQARRAHRSRRWRTVIEPVIVAWEGRATTTLHVAVSSGAMPYHIRIDCEQGEVVHAEGDIRELGALGGARDEGIEFGAFGLPLPGPLPTGYHNLTLELGDRSVSALVVSAPRRLYSPGSHRRDWGVFMPLYALRTERSIGAGDLGDLRELTDWVAERGGSVVGTLPLLAAFLDDPCDFSPYTPASRLAYNEFYLDLKGIPEFETCPAASQAIDGTGTAELVERLRGAKHVDYRAQMALKRNALEPMAEACWQSNSPRRAKLVAFERERPEIADYARFRSVGQRQNKNWQDWPQRLRDGDIRPEDYDPAVYRYHVYAQWNTHQQLESLAHRARAGGGLGLYLDLPVGVHGSGYDTWRHRDLYATGLSTGAPPDLLFDGGQNWAFPPLHPARIREDRYRHVIAILRNHLRYAGVLRIDHVMGLHRLYTIPRNFSAKQGVYIRYRAEELYAVLSLESHRANALILGENLGTVPEQVTQAMDAHGLHGMYVVQYAARPNPTEALPVPSPGSVASTGTHDMPAFRSFWEGLDIEQRKALGWIDDQEATADHGRRATLRTALRSFLGAQSPLQDDASSDDVLKAALVYLGRSRARLALATVEDLWGETHAQNVPGTWREHDNWTHRARHNFETWRDMPQVLSHLRALHQARKSAVQRSDVHYNVTRLHEQDLHFWGEGKHDRIYECLGAHAMSNSGTQGTYFAVWAPSADYVSVIGDFNGWDRSRCPLRARDNSGIWEGFVVGVGPGDLYKYHVAGPEVSEDKADPVGFRHELAPRTASVVAHLEYEWHDQDWMTHREATAKRDVPMSIYEVHLGSWMRIPEEGHRMLTYREIAPKLADYVIEMGFTHVELMPVMEHPFYGSWGYQVTGFFAATSRYGTPQDLMALIDHLHQRGIGVILDWVPSHFPSDAHGIARFDGTHLYEHADPRQGFHPDWESCIFNYGRYEVQSFLVSSAAYWLDKFHVDGLRVDAVASMLYLDYSRNDGEWIPNRYGGRENLDAIDLLRRLNAMVYQRFPGAQTIAEESTSWPMVSRPTYTGGLGFGYKWDMGWMHDTLSYLAREPVHRSYHHSDLTFRMIYAWKENFVLSLSHDEVVHGKGSLLNKMPGDRWQQFANLRCLFGFMFGQPGKKLIFMGQEFGQQAEWDHERSLDWHLLHDSMHAGVRRWVTDLNRLHREEPALHQLDCEAEGFEWIDFRDAQNSVYAFLRRGKQGPPIIVVCNFTPVARHGYRVGVPFASTWQEVLNSDARYYGGSDIGNGGRITSDDVPMHDRPHCVSLTLPPLSVLFLRPEGC